jgi:hypothetical protein
MIVKAAIGFLNEDTDDQLIANVQAAVQGLTNNTYFPTPAPSLEVMNTALATFINALAAAANRGKVEIANKNAKRAELVSLMRQLASYITVTAGGDMTKLLSSNFPIQKPVRSRIGQLPAPKSPELKRGRVSGELEGATVPIYGTGVYTWRLALASAPATYVQTVQTTGARHTFNGLTPGQNYNVEVNAIGSAGASDWSDVATMMVA